MKKLLMILFFSITCAHALWVPVNNINPEKEFANEKLCNRLTGSECINKPPHCGREFCEFEAELVDDKSKPIWAERSMIEPCDGKNDCEEKLSDKHCVDGRNAYINKEFTEVWCNKKLGFEKKEKIKIKFNQTEKEQSERVKKEIEAAKKKLRCKKSADEIMAALGPDSQLTRDMVKKEISDCQ